MITDMEYWAAKDIVRRYKIQEDKEHIEFIKNLHAENKKKDDEYQVKIDSGEVPAVVLTQEEKEFFRRM